MSKHDTIGINCGLNALGSRGQILVDQTVQINSGEISPRDFRHVCGGLITLIVEDPSDGTLLAVKYRLRTEDTDYRQIKLLPMKSEQTTYKITPIMWGRPHIEFPEWSLKVSAAKLKSSDFLRVANSRKSDFLSSLKYSKIKKFTWLVTNPGNSDVDESGDFIEPVRGSGRTISADEV
jgi:hypothetical protein